MINAFENIIVIRSVYGKVGQKYFINPTKDPKTGLFPDCVKHIDAKGDMILTEAEKNSGKIFIPENRVFIIEDGTTFNLNNPYEAANWYAIQHCPLIAMSRDARDMNGNLIIDGTPTRYGSAELYVERPGYETNKRVSKKKRIHEAESYILNDPKGIENLRRMAKVLGRPMKNAPEADVEDYLMNIAAKEPETIIHLYTSDEIVYRTLFVEACEKHVIYTKNKFYMYGDQGIILGATDDAVITWMRNPTNSKLLELIKKDTFPEQFMPENLSTQNNSEDGIIRTTENTTVTGKLKK